MALGVEVGGGVQGQGGMEERVGQGGGIGPFSLGIGLYAIKVGHLHTVLCQGARLIGTYHRYGAHGFAGM